MLVATHHENIPITMQCVAITAGYNRQKRQSICPHYMFDSIFWVVFGFNNKKRVLRIPQTARCAKWLYTFLHAFVDTLTLLTLISGL